MLTLEHGKPLLFGKNRDRGIRLNGLEPEIVTLGQNGITEHDILVHDETAKQPTLAYLLARMTFPEFPVPVGVFYSAQRPTLEGMLETQATQATAALGAGSLDRLLKSGASWTIS
jgi:2-oxoglutarate ferredoxin oxidoreductase subunit beta